jgi:nucleotide-binding universal stress UspA family protein
MLHLNRIFVATDFSDDSRAAYAFANAFAQKYGGKIDLLHVIPSFRYLNDSISRMGLPIDMDKDIYPRLLQDTEARLREDMSHHILTDHQGDVIVKVDFKAADCIARLAEQRQADVIVMGATGAANNVLFTGSTTEKVTRIATTPVLSIPKDAVPGDVNVIMVPSDYSETSFHALRGAMSMADSLTAEIVVFHVVELYGSLSENEARESGRDELDSIRENLTERIANWLERHPEYNIRYEAGAPHAHLVLTKNGEERRVPIKVKVTKGISAHYEVTEYANEHADMIVMTTHGRSGLNHLFLGSTTERVVHATDIPVLTWRPVKTA